MRHLWTVPILSLAFTSLAVVSERPVMAAILFESTLSGSQEVPPVDTSGNGLATAELSGSPGSWVLNYTINYSDLSSPIGPPYVHFHNAPFGMNGPIVHHVDGVEEPPIAGSTAGTILGDWRFDDAEDPLTDTLAQELINGNLYINIHTTLFPSGEIRGQIEQVPVASVPEPASLMGLAFLGVAGLLSPRRKTS